MVALNQEIDLRIAETWIDDLVLGWRRVENHILPLCHTSSAITFCIVQQETHHLRVVVALLKFVVVHLVLQDAVIFLFLKLGELGHFTNGVGELTLPDAEVKTPQVIGPGDL